MNIRGNHTDTIIELMRNVKSKGSSLNLPVRWIDPTHPVAKINDGQKINLNLKYLTLFV